MSTVHHVNIVATVQEVLHAALDEPPLALLVDMVTGMRARASEMRLLHNANLSWPILRANASTGGDITVVSTDPPKTAPLRTALDQIAAGDEQWQPGLHPRRFMRIPVRCRTHYECEPGQDLQRATVIDISPHGCFAVTYDPPEPGARVALELLDLGSTPLRLRGEVAWRRQWNESPELPGMGIAFDPAQTRDLQERLLDTHLLERLINQ